MNVFEFMKATRPVRELGNLGNQATGALFGGMFGGNAPFGSAFDQQSGIFHLNRWAELEYARQMAEQQRRAAEEMRRNCKRGEHKMLPTTKPVPGKYHTEKCVCGHTEEVLEAEYTVAALPPKE